MEAKIIGSRILHRVQFAPDPNNRAFPTQPRIVETRLIRDLQEFPEGVNYVSFDDVVETEVQFGNHVEKVYSEPFNESRAHHVLYERSASETWRRARQHYEIKVHPSLKGKIWVFGNSDQAKEQKAA